MGLYGRYVLHGPPFNNCDLPHADHTHTRLCYVKFRAFLKKTSEALGPKTKRSIIERRNKVRGMLTKFRGFEVSHIQRETHSFRVLALQAGCLIETRVCVAD